MSTKDNKFNSASAPAVVPLFETSNDWQLQFDITVKSNSQSKNSIFVIHRKIACNDTLMHAYANHVGALPQSLAPLLTRIAVEPPCHTHTAVMWVIHGAGRISGLRLAERDASSPIVAIRSHKMSRYR